MQRVLLYLQIAQGINQVPVRISYLSDDFDHVCTKLCVGKGQVLFGNFDLSARLVDLEVAHERLRVREGEIGLVLLFEGRKDDVSFDLRIGIGDLVLTAELWREPEDTYTPGTATGGNRSRISPESRAADREHLAREEAIEC